MRRRPAEVAVEDLGAIFVEGGLRGGVLGEEVGEGFEIIEKVGVG